MGHYASEMGYESPGRASFERWLWLRNTHGYANLELGNYGGNNPVYHKVCGTAVGDMETHLEFCPARAVTELGALVKPTTPGVTCTPTINGKRFYCECSCGVFTRRGSFYTCNACKREYEGTPA